MSDTCTGASDHLFYRRNFVYLSSILSFFSNCCGFHDLGLPLLCFRETRQWRPGGWAELDLRLSDGCSKHREHGEGDHNVVAVKGVSKRARAGMARKTSKASSLAPEEEASPSSRSHSRNLSLFEKLPVFSDVRNKTAGGGLIPSRTSLIFRWVA